MNEVEVEDGDGERCKMLCVDGVATDRTRSFVASPAKSLPRGGDWAVLG